MRLLILLLLAHFCATSVFADDIDACQNDETEISLRLSACEKVLENATDVGQAQLDLGLARLDADQFELAIESFSAALEFDVDRQRVLGRRAVAFGYLRQFEASRDDLIAAIEINPNAEWYHYRLGYVQNRLGDYQAALAALENAAAIDPDDYWTWFETSAVYENMGDVISAIHALHKASNARPFSIDIHNRVHNMAISAGLDDLAAYHARISYVLEPNQLSKRDWLLDYLGEPEEPSLPALQFNSSDVRPEIRYFSIVSPVDERDEVTKSIEDLIVFFGGKVYPIPESAAVQSIRMSAVEGDRLQPDVTVERSQTRAIARTDPLNLHRGLFSLEMQPLGPRTPVIGSRFEGAGVNALWPLQSSNETKGEGSLYVDCTVSSGITAVIMGCLPGRLEADLGRFDYEASVRTETIHVPMGIFDTYRVDFILDSSVSIMGKTNDLGYSASYWIAPELNTWVQRIFTVENTYVFHQAMELVTDK